MRLKIELQMNEDILLPFDYRRGIHAFIFSALDSQGSQELHDMDNGDIKPFVFSNLLGRFKLENNKIVFVDKCLLYISSPHFNILNDIYNFLVSSKHISLFGNYVPINFISQYIYKDYSGTISYKTISPITIYEKIDDKTIYYSPEDKQFKERIINNIKRKYEIVYGKELEDYFNIYKFENIKRQAVKFKDGLYTAYDMTLTMDCEKDIHHLVMDMGLGYRNPIGLGMIDYKKSK